MRKKSHTQFNFLVDFGGGARAGFQECSGLGTETTTPDYRGGDEKESAVRKITGLNKFTNITLKRGVVDSQSFNDWINDIRNRGKHALRTVVIHLQSEDRRMVQKWKLRGAQIIKHVSGPMNAKGTDVAMEELTLSCEQLEME